MAEAFNGKCGRIFKTHGNLFSFLTVYQKEEVVKTNELERDISGLMQKDTRKKRFKDRSLIIEHYSQLLSENKLRVARFLQIMANMDNQIIIQEHEYPVLNTEDIEFESIEDFDRFTAITKTQQKTLENTEKPNSTNDASPVIFESNSNGVLTMVTATKRKRTNKPKPTTKTTVLTRSKARKLALKQASVSDEQRINEIIPVHAESETDEMHPAKRAKEIPERFESSEVNVPIDISLQASTEEIDRLNEHFENIYNRKIEVRLGAECVMGCQRPKATVLLPCQHQPTCNQCYVLWRMFVDQKGKNRTAFCPFCRKKVTNTVAVNND